MESSLLSRYCPKLVLDSAEAACPIDARRYVTDGALLDTETRRPLGSLQSNLSNPESFIDLPARSSAISVAGRPLDISTEGVPLFGKVDTLTLDGTHVHSILYIACFPASAQDQLGAHFVKVFVNASSGAVIAAAFGVEGHLPHVWVDAQKLFFADRAMERVEVYVAKDDHTPLPSPGRLWRAGPGKTSPSCDGQGAEWQASQPLVLPWPNALMQFLGRLGPSPSSVNPVQRPWWDGATTQKISMSARFIG